MGADTTTFVIFTGGLLFCGTFNSLIAKLIYGLQAPGAGGHVHHFEKPWFQTTNMFLGMILCMGLYQVKLRLLAAMQRRRGQAEDSEAVPLLKAGSAASPPEPTRSEMGKAQMVIIPAIADLAATGLMFSGLIFTTVSIYQMLRGAQVIFCAILSVVFQKMEMDFYMKLGIAFTVLGITLVGSASVLRDDTSKVPLSTELFGIFLILLAQFIQAVQMVLEQSLLQGVKMDALQVAGWEGVFGGILSVFVILPLFQTIPGGDAGSLENTEDSLLMLRNNHAIILAEVLNCLSVLSYNYFGLTLTQSFTAMHRVIIEASRSLLVWVVDLAIFYLITNGEFGEAWTSSSWIQMCGFIVLLIGTVLYNYTTLFGVDEDAEQGQGRTHSVASQGSGHGSVCSRASQRSHSSFTHH